jgi:cellulose synthase/poly-beta-1,6-N-acetylglucosamine synthase-like glycosyltransferase
MRSFLLFRPISTAFNGTTIISGAFGLFRRDAVIAVGGFDREAVAEDMDLTIRLQTHFRRQGHPIRTRFVPIPVCWTQGPEDWRSLRAQRCRWRRGLLEVLWRHRHVIGNPRYGMVGMVVLPYSAFFEGLGPLIETAGYVITTVAAVIGLLNWGAYRTMLALSVLFGATTTLMAVFLSDTATRRYRRVRDLVLLGAAAALENVGYRQLNAWWGCVGTVQALRGKRGWGTMKRQSFS